jgi:hypothetical protein
MTGTHRLSPPTQEFLIEIDRLEGELVIDPMRTAIQDEHRLLLVHVVLYEPDPMFHRPFIPLEPDTLTDPIDQSLPGSEGFIACGMGEHDLIHFFPTDQMSFQKERHDGKGGTGRMNACVPQDAGGEGVIRVQQDRLFSRTIAFRGADEGGRRVKEEVLDDSVMLFRQ